LGSGLLLDLRPDIDDRLRLRPKRPASLATAIKGCGGWPILFHSLTPKGQKQQVTNGRELAINRSLGGSIYPG